MAPCESQDFLSGRQVPAFPPSRVFISNELSPLNWQGQDHKDYGYIHTLSHAEISEIKSTLAKFKDLELEGNEVNKQKFPLPLLKEKLSSHASELHTGRGFCVIRGLDPRDFTVEDNLLVFLGISSHIGDKRAKQNLEGHMLEHIFNASDNDLDEHARPFRHSKRAGTFHTDNYCDILALQVRSCADKGGNTIIASSLAICNRLRETRPDVLKLLAQPDWPVPIAGSDTIYERRPLYFEHNGQIILNFVRHQLTGCDGSSVTNPDQPPLSSKQLEALDIVEQVAKDCQLVLDIQRGDLVFINNHAILHSREAFEDFGENTRYFVRLWLKNTYQAWLLPEALRPYNTEAFDIEEDTQTWNIVPCRESNTKTYIKERWTSPG